MTKSAIVLASGGLDSTTCLGIALDEGMDVTAVSFDYDQRHKVELDAVRRVLDHYGVQKRLVIDAGFLRVIGGSALTSEAAVPTHERVDDLGQDIPATYVPARNLIFLSCAVAVAEVGGATDIFIGINALDYSGYPDCRPEFLEQFRKTANLATKVGVEGNEPLRFRAPLMKLTKAEIIRQGMGLKVPYELTHSCYSPDEEGMACGHCDSCLLRLKGFEEAGYRDPVQYAATVG